ncbi:MAG: cyclopropane fatty acyl phospholipid synthase [Alphaproteobacteria bacterium]|jgi:cyclopropane-fatty-acyl-phospholipid synthase|nr:cyclopropane fatty acyl phospholipid synthase [Alphaproteobacteria bacterium]
MKQIVQDILLLGDIKINGTRPWDIIVHDERLYNRLIKNTDLGLGESYMDGWWDCQSLDEFFYRVIRSDLKTKAIHQPHFWQSLLIQKLFEAMRGLFNFQTKERAFIVGEKHYDIDNDLYEKMLDKRLTYTCGYWDNGAKNLNEAQEAKLELTCQKLQLKPGMRILDIGCGWGSFAKYAAEKYKVSVSGVTISREQIHLAEKLCKGLPVEFYLQDYRDLQQLGLKFDRIVSLGMFEHVGYKNYKTYMEVAAKCLKDDGLFLLHTIGSNFSTTTCQSPWIDKYIFPNGQVPSIEQINTSIEGQFIMEDWHNFGSNYDTTLMAWHKNFNDSWDSLKGKYDDRFRRMWNYYLLSCAGSFRARDSQLWQIVLSRRGIVGGYVRPSIVQTQEPLRKEIKAPAKKKAGSKAKG